jgi:uncharacterized protein (DUF111 family)
MRVLYVYGYAGVSGASLLGALLHAGAPLAAVQAGWQRLQLPLTQVGLERVPLEEYTATRLVCPVAHLGTFLAQHTYATLLEHIEQSDIAERARQRLLRLLGRFAAAVAHVHNAPEPEVVLRSAFMPAVLSMGSGVALALEALAIEQLLSAPVNLGVGPHPLTTELARGVPVYGDRAPGALTTVDGVAILASMAMSFGPLPAMTIVGTGYGAAAEATGEARQGLQVLLGEVEGPPMAERIAVLETNIDDMNPEFYEVVFEHLFTQGALDVTLTPLLMKKGRPANKLTVLAPLSAVARLSRLVLQETSTFGVRVYEVWRQKLERFSRPVETCYGVISVKCGVLDGRMVQAAPEYEACKRAAVEHSVPVRLVYSEAARLAAPWLL